ncbi:hypothetical protein IH601_00385 [Candidatus Bipolaricaulota bacterium]|nr:hypothetical protein [Candidatus Bipolaricaulota bacterium]
MKNAVLVVLTLILLCPILVSAVDLESISFGFHFIPSVEPVNGNRLLDMTLSIGGTLRLDSENGIELMAMVDSGASSLGTSAQFNHRDTEPLKAGVGFTVLWPFTDEFKLVWPIVGTYAHASGRAYLFRPQLWFEGAVSFPLLTLANQADGWNLLPLSELPSLSLSADVKLADHASIQPRVTFQPVIVDTTVLDSPIGRISDDLLILPMVSIFLRYIEDQP